MKYYIYRITHDKVKLFFILILIVLPMAQVLQTWWACSQSGLEMYDPMYATFQSLPGMAHHIIHRVYMWFIPLYLLIIFAEVTIEDAETKLVNPLLCKFGKTRYVMENIFKSFSCSFLLIMAAMMINLILCCIVFRDGTFLGIDPTDSPENILYNISNAHPFIANVGFDLVASFVCALICTVGVAVSLVVPNRKIVYSVSLLLWLVPIAMKKSLMLLFQPFSEYDFSELLPTFFIVTGAYLLVIVGAVFWRIRDEEV